VLKSSEEDFAKNGKRYDLILAAAGYRSLFYYTRALSPKGIYVVTEGSMAQIFQPMLLGPWITMTESKKMDNLSVRPNQEDLVIMKELIETGKVKSVINRCYTLSEIAEALRYCDEGHARVKVVISLEHNNKT
jgi:D-arabinose 1-dehydrogenase-like Zn-dependent alcohol dehydrogenase